MPNKLSQFWQEIKRRNVHRLMAVYGGTAYIVFEASNMIFPRWGLPDWTIDLVLYLLILGAIITFVLGWVYDVTPEGVQKTKPARELKEGLVHTTPNGWKIASYISFIVILGLIAFNIFGGNRAYRIDESLEKSVAVLPFRNLSGDPGQDFICEGLTEEVINNLYKIKAFERVPSMTTVLNYKETNKILADIAEELQVNYILDPSYKRMEDMIRFTVTLIEPRSDKQVWQWDYDLPNKEILGIPGEIALQIANNINAFISEEEQERIQLSPTERFDAYELYLMGRQRINRLSRDSDMWEAIDYFHQAIEVDSTYALAYSGLAEAYYQIVNRAILSPTEAFPKARTYSLKALELNKDLAESHITLGLVRQSFEYDFDEAEKEFKKALEINPANPNVHRYYALFLTMMGRHDEAIFHSNTAIRLDPSSPIIEGVKYWVLYAASNKDQTLEMAEQYRDANPDFPMGYWQTVVFYVDQEMYEKALTTNLAAIDLMGEDNISDEIGILGHIYGKLGQTEKAKSHIRRLDELSANGEYVDPRAYVWAYLGLNEIEKAAEILDQAINEHTFDPLYYDLFPSAIAKSDPRFIKLQKKIGLIP